MKLQKVNRKHVSYVELEKDGKTPIGLSIKDGTKYGFRPIIKNIKSQSLSHRSHCVSEGDVLLSVCGEDSKGLSRKEVRRRLKEASRRIELTLHYESREPCFDNYGVYRYENVSLRLRRDSGSFGFILRKNDTADSASSEFPTITNIRPGGPADKEKCLQDGDRLLKIDDQSLSWLSLSEVSSILKEKQEAVFVIEYKVRIVDFCTNVGVQNEMEIDCLDDIGLILGSPKQGSKLLIQEIRTGSLAQRCGAFKQGDVVESINDIDTALLTPSKANSLLQRFRKESGKLVFIPSQGGQCLRNRLNPNVAEMVDNRTRCNASNLPKTSLPINHSKKNQTSKERTRPPDSPRNVPSTSERSSNPKTLVPSTRDLQCRTVAMLTDVVRNVSRLGYFVSYLGNEVARTNNNDDESPSNNKIRVNPFVFSQLKSAFAETKTSVHSLALQVTRHQQCGESEATPDIAHLLPQVKNDLSAMERKNLLPGDIAVQLRSRLDAARTDCEGCREFCTSALHLMQKVALLSSFVDDDRSSPQTEVCGLLERARGMSCPDCREENTTGRRVRNIPPPADSVIVRERRALSELNQLSIDTDTGGGTPSLSDLRSDASDFNIRVGPPLEVPPDNHWVNYQTSKVHKEKDCFQKRTSDSENVLSSDENEQVVEERRGSSGSLTTRVKRFGSNNLRAGSWNASSSSSSGLPGSSRGSPGQTSSEKWETTSECLSSSSRLVSGRGPFSARAPLRKGPSKKRTSMNVKLKDEGFGLGFDVEHTSRKGVFKGPYISYLHPLGAAKKCGIIKVGDKLLEVNGLDLEGLPVSLLDGILRQSLEASEVELKVEFEVATPEVKEGTFEVRLEKGLTCGIMFEGDEDLLHASRVVPALRRGSGLKVRGVVKGSAAHRSGHLFAGDEVVRVRSVKEESYEPLNTAHYSRRNFTLITVRRGTPTASEISLLPSLPPFVVRRSTVRTLSKERRVVDHELTLHRDFGSAAGDRFGFGIKINPCSGNVYVSKLRRGGPADASGVVRLDDRILEVNGTIIGRNNKSSIAEKFKVESDCIDLVIRRILPQQLD